MGTQQIVYQGRLALERNVCDIDVGAALEQFQEEMRDGRVARRSTRELPRLRFRQCDLVVDGFRAEPRSGIEHEVCGDDLCDGGKVALRVIAERGIYRG
jgi:hypothetical protein